MAREVETIARLRPSMICSGHLPAARRDDVDRVLYNLLDAPAGEPFVGHDQSALRTLLDQASR